MQIINYHKIKINWSTKVLTVRILSVKEHKW